MVRFFLFTTQRIHSCFERDEMESYSSTVKQGFTLFLDIIEAFIFLKHK